MIYNYNKLKGRIIEKFQNQQKFASAMNWSERTCSLKLTGKVFWKQPEITKAAKLLEINSGEVETFFFDLNVQKIEHKEDI